MITAPSLVSAIDPSPPLPHPPTPGLLALLCDAYTETKRPYGLNEELVMRPVSMYVYMHLLRAPAYHNVYIIY